MITSSDIRWLSQAARGIYAAQGVGDFAHASTDALDRRYALVSSACEEVGARGTSYVAHRLRTSVAPPRDHIHHYHDNPFNEQLLAGVSRPILHMRQQFPMEAWERTDHYNGIAKPMGWHDQLMLIAQSQPTLVAVGLYRDIPFTGRERELMALFQPHLEVGWRRIQGTHPNRQPLRMTLTRDLIPREPMPAIHRWLRSYFPGAGAPTRLPDELIRWVRDCLALFHTAPPKPLRAFVQNAARGRLCVRCFPSWTDQTTTLCFVETRTTKPTGGARQTPLTPREREILEWLVLGKRDAEIATILCVSAKTVSKHVEHLLRKMNASSRTVAAQLALGARPNQATG